MLLHCEVNDEYPFFEKVWKFLTGDIQYQFKSITRNCKYELSESRLKDYLLDDLDILFGKNGGRMKDYNFPQKNTSSQQVHGNRLIQEELAYDIAELLCESEEHIGSLNVDQMHAFKSITHTISNGMPGFFSCPARGDWQNLFMECYCCICSCPEKNCTHSCVFWSSFIITTWRSNRSFTI